VQAFALSIATYFVVISDLTVYTLRPATKGFEPSFWWLSLLG